MSVVTCQVKRLAHNMDTEIDLLLTVETLVHEYFGHSTTAAQRARVFQHLADMNREQAASLGLPSQAKE